MREKSMQAVKAEEKGRKCPDCGSVELEYDEHEQLVCKKCGFVVEE